MDLATLVPNVDALTQGLAADGYLAGPGLATALFCAVRLNQPLLLEGEPGVGKTQAALALPHILQTPLFRLQCYEGIDATQALYEWNYQRQLLRIRLAEVDRHHLEEQTLFDDSCLIERPVLQALRHPGPQPAVLLIDEIDRADEAFEAFLLQALAEAAITIPEFGTIQASVRPIVVLTSNRTRDLHDALKRRCLYHWIDFPDTAQLLAIIQARAPRSDPTLVRQIAECISRLRELGLQKPPGIAESLDWIRTATLLGITQLDEGNAYASLGSVLKYHEDLRTARATASSWLPASR